MLADYSNKGPLLPLVSPQRHRQGFATGRARSHPRSRGLQALPLLTASTCTASRVRPGSPVRLASRRPTAGCRTAAAYTRIARSSYREGIVGGLSATVSAPQTLACACKAQVQVAAPWGDVLDPIYTVTVSGGALNRTWLVQDLLWNYTDVNSSNPLAENVCGGGRRQWWSVGTTTPINCNAGTYRGTSNGTQQGDCTTCPSGR